MSVDYNEEKFKELILYISEACRAHPIFGATKLNKILFFSDFIAYEDLGSSITGAEYMALEFGPAPREMIPIREEMVLNGDIVIERRGSQTRLVPERPPNSEIFSPEERAIVDRLIELLKCQDAEWISELSHKFLGWRAAWAETLYTGGWATIPYETVHVSNTPINEAELIDGLTLAEEHGWSLK
ncbi:MAG: Panacea domain-containing protein [Chloroflexi bacterium]|nr:Panacea domain-containing protein [Chloroflexota bacterium]MDA1271364.1 Panacea domain-containing protein [Chloroflexota bacterium]